MKVQEFLKNWWNGEFKLWQHYWLLWVLPQLPLFLLVEHINSNTLELYLNDSFLVEKTFSYMFLSFQSILVLFGARGVFLSSKKSKAWGFWANLFVILSLVKFAFIIVPAYFTNTVSTFEEEIINLRQQLPFEVDEFTTMNAIDFDQNKVLTYTYDFRNLPNNFVFARYQKYMIKNICTGLEADLKKGNLSKIYIVNLQQGKPYNSFYIDSESCENKPQEEAIPENKNVEPEKKDLTLEEWQSSVESYPETPKLLFILKENYPLEYRNMMVKTHKLLKNNQLDKIAETMQEEIANVYTKSLQRLNDRELISMHETLQRLVETHQDDPILCRFIIEGPNSGESLTRYKATEIMKELDALKSEILLLTKDRTKETYLVDGNMFDLASVGLFLEKDGISRPITEQDLEVVSEPSKYSNSEYCQSYKVFLENVLSLKDEYAATILRAIVDPDRIPEDSTEEKKVDSTEPSLFEDRKFDF